MSVLRALLPLTREPKELFAAAVMPVLLPLMRVRRRMLRDALVVGVTGSAGKTTAKNLIAAVLRGRFQGRASAASRNRHWELGRVILRARRSDRFLVQELGAAGPDTLDAMLWALRPDVGVVLTVAQEHWSAFRSLDAVTREKAKLIEVLPASGLAVLNADDPRVLAMRERTRARVMLVGRSPEADLRAEEIFAAWPEPLRFTAVRGDERVEVRTLLSGEHFVPNVLAALAVGLEAGIPLAEAAAAPALVEPERHRLSEARLSGDITFLEDDWKASAWNLEESFEVLRRARAARKLIVLGRLSDASASSRVLYRRTAARCLEIADHVIVVGRWAHYAARVRGRGKLHIAGSAREAHELLRDLLAPGDLVLLKSNMRPDHLERLVLARQTDELRCWRTTCALQTWCHDCRLRTRPSPAASNLPQPASVRGS
jgi:UDP-N-acetylmuramoyl-tripeptide--D-alanyl-D-alanine ligase